MKNKNVGRRLDESTEKIFLRTNNGITLVALVVTIIVLLILVGVSINLVAGSNGILGRAQKAVDVNNMAQIKEEIELKIAELQMDYYMTDNNFASANDYVKAELQKGIELSNGAEVSCDESGKLSYEGLEIGTLNSDGTVTIDGELSGNQIVSKYAVSYNSNGGTGVPASKKYAAGESVTVDFTTKPTKKGANFLGWATSSTATTPEYTTSGNFTMGTQNVTLYAVWENFAAATISASNYGDAVNYSANGVNDWQVFLNDGENVYMIASDYVPSSGVTITSDVAKVDGTDYKVKGNSRDGLVNWLTTPSNWSQYVNTSYADQATGGPTKAQFVASYNAKYGTSHSSGLSGTDDDFRITNEVAPYIINSDINCNAYWLSSVSSSHDTHVWDMGGNSYMGTNGYNYPDYGVRPLARLKASVKVTWNGTAWDLSN